MEIKPEEELVTRSFFKQTLYYSVANQIYYYKLQLNPFNFKQISGLISVEFENQIENQQSISYYLPINHFLFTVEFLKSLTQYQDIFDALINVQGDIKEVDFSKCPFLDQKNELYRFNKDKYVEFCKEKYNILIQENAQFLAPIFFQQFYDDIVPKQLFSQIENSYNRPKVSQRTAKKVQPKIGSIDRFVTKK
ncbi:hypothetical protein SS50377_23675 [Spironucleus salmonicida]|uniref:Uncharacterized protein n=1 Tax=Spironucleus salmonicida TaxID=348837 RepID=V6LWQ5_9EUKA|nr:hypothetical protein SS50377_23675 [Spironucleus salmonicida]|eukprot:EST48658.1 Hypothetical protein SS50377_11271 [Spironucleus salmonicida]